jgi:5-methyltetrahydropteroyltriglutamate--homocysteine methyltransferase
MKPSTDRILTTHAGSLSRPADIIALSRARSAGESKKDDAYAACLAASVAEVVRKQLELGIDIPDDGEFGKPVAGSYDYGAWWNYAFARMSGFSPRAGGMVGESKHRKSAVADLALTSFANRRDWQKFSAFYPQVVADRIVRYAKAVGRENVIAGTDCGLGGRIHPQIAWAKLQALSDGARLASRELWA